MSKHAYVTGAPHLGYHIVLDELALRLGFEQLPGITLPRYRVAQDMANAVNAHVNRFMDALDKQAIRNGTLRIKS